MSADNIKRLSVDDIADILTNTSNSGKSLLIFFHKSPDGDAVGSAFALKLICASLGIRARCVCCDEPAPYLRFLYSGQTEAKYKDGEENDFGILCSVDTASPAQLGALSHLSEQIDFMIDHHGLGAPYAPAYLEPDYSACGELIYKVYCCLAERGKLERDAEISRRLFAAISADTGSFKYSNTTPDTLRIAAELMQEINSAGDGGENCAEISRILHDCKTIGALRAEAAAIENLHFAASGKVAYVVFTADMMERGGLCEDDLGALIDLPRSIEGVEAGFTVKQTLSDRNVFRISTRSNTDLNVADICRKLGGGGHVKAAGATITAESPEAACKAVIDLFEEALASDCGRKSENQTENNEVNV